MKHIKAKSETSLLKHGRGADRFDIELPVEIGGIQGSTRNIGATGIYFVAELTPETGSRVHFAVEMHVHGAKQKLVCDGEVVRVDHKNGMLGIAAKLMASFFSDAAEVIDIETGSLSGTH